MNDRSRMLKEAADGIIMLSNDQQYTEICYAILKGENWEYKVNKVKFSMKEDNKHVEFIYNKTDKKWKMYVLNGHVLYNGEKIDRGVVMIRDKSIIDFSAYKFQFCYVIKSKKSEKTYQELIKEAIMASENQRLTLAQIYSYFSRLGFDDIDSATWKNSIRHNLSLNKDKDKNKSPFKKIPREEGESLGKGMYWILNPAYKIDDENKEGQSLTTEKPIDSLYFNKDRHMLKNDQLFDLKKINNPEFSKVTNYYDQFFNLKDEEMNRRKHNLEYEKENVNNKSNFLYLNNKVDDRGITEREIGYIEPACDENSTNKYTKNYESNLNINEEHTDNIDDQVCCPINYEYIRRNSISTAMYHFPDINLTKRPVLRRRRHLMQSFVPNIILVKRKKRKFVYKECCKRIKRSSFQIKYLQSTTNENTTQSSATGLADVYDMVVVVSDNLEARNKIDRSKSIIDLPDEFSNLFISKYKK